MVQKLEKMKLLFVRRKKFIFSKSENLKLDKKKLKKEKKRKKLIIKKPFFTHLIN